MFFTGFALRGLRLFTLKIEAKQHKQRNSPQTYKTEIKILTYRGLG